MSKPESAEQPGECSRRDALKAGLAIASAPAVLTVHAASDPVKFGLIGVGSRGSYLTEHLAKLDGGRCVALCDVNESALDNTAAKLTTNPKKYKDFRELLADENVEAVVIAVPLHLYFAMTRDSLLAGRHVFCEASLVFKAEEVKDGRDVFNNIQLIYSYPNGRKMMCSAITTCQHVPLLCSQRSESGVVVMGTDGAVEIALGDDAALPTALWFRESLPAVPPTPQKGIPIITPANDADDKNDSFLVRESKVARRWLYEEGLMFPQEDRKPIDTQLESFLSDVRSGNGRAQI